ELRRDDRHAGFQVGRSTRCRGGAALSAEDERNRCDRDHVQAQTADHHVRLIAVPPTLPLSSRWSRWRGWWARRSIQQDGHGRDSLQDRRVNGSWALITHTTTRLGVVSSYPAGRDPGIGFRGGWRGRLKPPQRVVQARHKSFKIT